MKQKFIIIGTTDTPVPSFPSEVQTLIRQGRIFSGGVRHQELVAHLLPEKSEWIPITVPLDNVFRSYESAFTRLQDMHHDQDAILVFASGDPLFFGFANTIRRRLPDAEITLYPTFNSLQTLAHRLVISYDDMLTVSLTGRPWQGLDRALIERASKIGILTDREHTPTAIANRLLEYGYGHYSFYIAEHVGNPSHERIRKMTSKEVVSQTFEHPNCLIITAGKEKSENAIRPFGIPDEQFVHLEGRPRMITKAPIRLLTLQTLQLNRHHTFWDIGFCTGSVSIEARLQFPHLTVVAFEVRPEGRALMHTNSRRFGAPGITTIIGDFLQADISVLPPPDAVFIGGHGGQLPQILQKIKKVLLPDGCIVFNAVSDQSRKLFADSIAENGMVLHSSLHVAINDYNPIEIMKATF